MRLLPILKIQYWSQLLFLDLQFSLRRLSTIIWVVSKRKSKRFLHTNDLAFNVRSQRGHDSLIYCISLSYSLSLTLLLSLSLSVSQCRGRALVCVCASCVPNVGWTESRTRLTNEDGPAPSFDFSVELFLFSSEVGDVICNLKSLYLASTNFTAPSVF